MYRFRTPIKFIVGMLVVTLLVAGCDATIPGLSPTQTLTPASTATLTPTTTPSPTTTPLPPIGLLLVPGAADARLAAEVQSQLSQWVPEMGYRFQVRPSISEADLDRDDFDLIVALDPYPEITTLAANHPEIRFLTLGIQGLEPAPNLTTIGTDGNRLDHQGFVAGYMAAMITPDWRVGVIGYSDSQDTIAARQTFFTGVKFYCGLCLPAHPPFYEYPLYFELGADADTVAWRTAADYMIHRGVTTVYVVPGAGDDPMFQHLSDAGVIIIGGIPAPPVAEGHWAASLSFDLLNAFLETWSQFVEGTSPGTVTLPLQIMEIDEELLSPGKQRLVEATMADMLSGYIDLGLLEDEGP